MLSGVVYSINDVADREADRAASGQDAPADRVGRRPGPVALATAAVLGVGGARRPRSGCGRRSAARRASTSALLALYSGPLKHIVIIDVLTIAVGFVLRAAAGAVVIDVADQPLAATS